MNLRNSRLQVSRYVTPGRHVACCKRVRRTGHKNPRRHLDASLSNQPPFTAFTAGNTPPARLRDTSLSSESAKSAPAILPAACNPIAVKFSRDIACADIYTNPVSCSLSTTRVMALRAPFFLCSGGHDRRWELDATSTLRCDIDLTLRIGSTQSTEAFKQTTNGSPLKGGSDRYIGTKRLQPRRFWRTRPE